MTPQRHHFMRQHLWITWVTLWVMMVDHLISCFVCQLFQFYGGGHTWKVNIGHPDNFQPLLKYFLFHKKMPAGPPPTMQTSHSSAYLSISIPSHLSSGIILILWGLCELQPGVVLSRLHCVMCRHCIQFWVGAEPGGKGRVSQQKVTRKGLTTLQAFAFASS